MKVVLISGGASGIGAALAKMFSIDNVVFILDKKAPLYPWEGMPLVHFMQCDISDEMAVKKCLLSVKKSVGPLNVLINCAGMQTIEDWDHQSSDNWKRVINTNLNGTFFLMQHGSRMMAANSSIVTISSIHSSVPRVNKFAYDASKAALNQLNCEAAIVLGPRGIRVNLVEPGYIDTPMNAHETATTEYVSSKIPLKRVGTTTDVANLVMFLCSDEASYITGANISVDGGRRLIK